MEYHTHFLTLSPPIHQAIDLPATHQSSSDLLKPNTSLLYSNQQMRVSQKLLQNKIRKLQIEYQKQQEKQSLLERRRRRQKQIYIFQKRRQALAQQQREASLRSNRNELTEKIKNEEEQKLVRINQMQASDAMIDLCRKRVQEKKQEYIIRIQNKTRQRQERAHRKRKMIERVTQKTNDQIHLEQWKQYEAQILKKHQNETMKPDRLYQQFKKKNLQLKSIFQEKNKQNRQVLTPQPHKTHTSEGKNEVQGINRITTGQPYFRVNKKTEFYGVHEEDMMKKTLKDLWKMRKFIEQHTTQTNPLKDQLLASKFEDYLLKEILK